ncbi:hypothetical protein LCI18_014044 [Fusarium solani-melongenae]|uniref:Uncharacterized protein n=1 Tax=Fusarium solani subsp. cucurbitae TaxID=2747967 RepID=A0ACD3ZP57_FUSSC|nr:hypothetical protein LCI18_014044 [Fusarium solani-melongenae]
MFLLSSLLLAAVAVQASSSGQASNFPVSARLAAEYDCGKSCQSTLEAANAVDLHIFSMPFDFDFYATADNFSTSKPGDLLKLSPVDPKLLALIPPGVAVYKFQYTSTDLDNSPVPATGFIALPYVRGTKPFDLVAFAHGTTGMFRGCAPSTSSFLFDYTSWTPLLLDGYAVVATDYAGIGNNYTAHKYIASRANANDVYWSTLAARNAFPGAISKNWASIGHSQGGGAVWKLSEHELVQSNCSGYLGGVSIAPATYPRDHFVGSFSKLSGLSPEELRAFGIVGVFPSMTFALRAVFPEYHPAYFTDLLKKRVALAEVAQLCDTAMSGLVLDLDLSQVVKNLDFVTDPILERFQELNSPALGDKASKPLLVIQGANDTIVFADVTVKAYKNGCKAGNPIRLSMYPDLDHSSVVAASAPEWLLFLRDLFNHEGVQKRQCSFVDVDPFDVEDAIKPLDAEWTWYDPW